MRVLVGGGLDDARSSLLDQPGLHPSLLEHPELHPSLLDHPGLHPALHPAPLDHPALRSLYAAPGPWLRVNMVSSVDGAATGESGKSGSINNAADKVVFGLLRELSDAVVVGAGTLREEGYRPIEGKPLVAVSRRAAVPPRLREAPAGSVLMVTCSSAESLDEARSVLGTDNVIVAGEDQVDLARAVAHLHDRGLTRLLSEGGPKLLADLLAADLVDELDATMVPRLVGGDGPRIVDGPHVDVPLSLHLLLEEDGTLLGRWLTHRGLAAVGGAA